MLVNKYFIGVIFIWICISYNVYFFKTYICNAFKLYNGTEYGMVMFMLIFILVSD